MKSEVAENIIAQIDSHLLLAEEILNISLEQKETLEKNRVDLYVTLGKNREKLVKQLIENRGADDGYIKLLGQNKIEQSTIDEYPEMGEKLELLTEMVNKSVELDKDNSETIEAKVKELKENQGAKEPAKDGAAHDAYSRSTDAGQVQTRRTQESRYVDRKN